MTVKSKIYFAILFVVGLASVTFIYYRITGQDIFTIFRQETVTPVAKPNEPKLTVEIQRSGGEDVLIMRWDNIPANTARIKIYRAKAGTTQWELWKTVNLQDIVSGKGGGISGGTGGGGATGAGTAGGINIDGGIFSGDIESGNFSISLGKTSEGNGDYVYYVEAVASGTSGTNNGAGTGSSTETGGPSEETVLWTSPITPTVISTSTPSTTAPTPTTGTNTPPPTTPPSTQPSSTTQSTGTPSQSPSPTPTSTTPTQTPTPTPKPSGIPYYNPQGGISGYGQPQTENFWVDHMDNNIDIGWQNLPLGTEKFVVSRSADQNGPWLAVLTQENPPSGGPYSIKILDQTLYDPYYYKMDVYDADGDITATYGPEYLPALGQ